MIGEPQPIPRYRIITSDTARDLEEKLNAITNYHIVSMVDVPTHFYMIIMELDSYQ